MILHREGNILNSGADVICHQVNCMGAMNSGVAKAIRQRWPQVYTEYRNAARDLSADDEFCDEELSWMHMHGHIQPVYISETNQTVINMFAQRGYGYDGARYTSYDAFWTCLCEIREHITPGKKIAFPARIGCVRGGADWTIIQTMIIRVLLNDYDIEFWDYDKG